MHRAEHGGQQSKVDGLDCCADELDRDPSRQVVFYVPWQRRPPHVAFTTDHSRAGWCTEAGRTSSSSRSLLQSRRQMIIYETPRARTCVPKESSPPSRLRDHCSQDGPAGHRGVDASPTSKNTNGPDPEKYMVRVARNEG
jgi:hypothetical protein